MTAHTDREIYGDVLEAMAGNPDAASAAIAEVAQARHMTVPGVRHAVRRTIEARRTQAADRLTEVPGLWRVTVTNGSGVKTVEVDGTQRTAWTWAAEAARRGAFGDGAWAPSAIDMVGPASGNNPFTGIAYNE
jgi:hypothetical protein